MATKPKPAKATKTKFRSPNYPAVSLKEAMERVRKIYKADGRAGAPVESAVKLIGYSGAHGKAMTVLSALSKFGLTENKVGRIVPTAAAVDIIEFPPSHERHQKAIREAALSPAIYRSLIDRFRGAGALPSDESLKPELVADFKFSPAAASGFVKDLRESLEFAGLLSGNELKLSTEVDGRGEDAGESELDMTESAAELGFQGGQPPAPLTPPPPKPGVKQDRMTLGDCQVIIQRPERLTEDVYNDLKSMLSLVLRNAKRAIPGGEAK